MITINRGSISFGNKSNIILSTDNQRILTYGVLGIDYDLPFSDYTWSGADSTIGTYFTCSQTATAYQQNIKAVSDAPGNQVKAYAYLWTGASSGTLIITSSQTLSLGTTPEILSFTQNFTITSGSSYWLFFQSQNAIRYYYDTAPVNYYGYMGAQTFGVAPSSFSGIFTNANVTQASLNYYY